MFLSDTHDVFVRKLKRDLNLVLILIKKRENVRINATTSITFIKTMPVLASNLFH
jgi:hypothetical protein